MYGCICEGNSKLGCPDTFYNMAACCCHCRDEIGFFSPIVRRMYRCEDCGIEMCEGCAKSCHKNHKIV